MIARSNGLVTKDVRVGWLQRPRELPCRGAPGETYMQARVVVACVGYKTTNMTITEDCDGVMIR